MGSRRVWQTARAWQIRIPKRGLAAGSDRHSASARSRGVCAGRVPVPAPGGPKGIFGQSTCHSNVSGFHNRQPAMCIPTSSRRSSRKEFLFFFFLLPSLEGHLLRAYGLKGYGHCSEYCKSFVYPLISSSATALFRGFSMHYVFWKPCTFFHGFPPPPMPPEVF